MFLVLLQLVGGKTEDKHGKHQARIVTGRISNPDPPTCESIAKYAIAVFGMK